MHTFVGIRKQKSRCLLIRKHRLRIFFAFPKDLKTFGAEEVVFWQQKQSAAV